MLSVARSLSSGLHYSTQGLGVESMRGIVSQSIKYESTVISKNLVRHCRVKLSV